ncbi:MAG: prepilin-type N-terminal cleavage/methylation domain-containing protein [Candidatus Omnitrophota bacterium]
MKKPGEQAFTLVELMISLVIIGVLVGLILPRFKGMRDQGKISKAQGELRAIKAAMESYFIKNNGYPPTTTTVCAGYLTTSAVYPRILQNPLYDPFGATTTTEYNYAVSPNARYYVMYSLGADATAQITGIGDDGVVTPSNRGDDVWTSNAQ